MIYICWRNKIDSKYVSIYTLYLVKSIEYLFNVIYQKRILLFIWILWMIIIWYYNVWYLLRITNQGQYDNLRKMSHSDGPNLFQKSFMRKITDVQIVIYRIISFDASCILRNSSLGSIHDIRPSRVIYFNLTS